MMPQPYLNPYYFQQPTYQMQSPIYQSTQTPQINGRIIDSIDSVSANDVSMQGFSLFPKSDLSEIYVKAWNPNGTIKTTRYLPYNPEENNGMGILSTNTVDGAKQGAENVSAGIMERLNSLEDKIDKLLKPAKGKKEQTDES